MQHKCQKCSISNIRLKYYINFFDYNNSILNFLQNSMFLLSQYEDWTPPIWTNLVRDFPIRAMYMIEALLMFFFESPDDRIFHFSRVYTHICADRNTRHRPRLRCFNDLARTRSECPLC